MSATEGPKVAEFLQVGLAVVPRAVYIERPEDSEVHRLLAQGTYVNLLTSRQMGKSSLVHRVMARLRDEGVFVVFADMSSVGGNQLRDREAWYRSLLFEMTTSIGASKEFKTWWKERTAEETMGARFRAFVDHFLLSKPGRIVVVFDEVDVTRDLGFTDDLFLAMRFLHNARVDHPELERLTFCVVGVLAPDDLIKSTTRTPYNAGKTIRLSDFKREQMGPLVAYLDSRGLPGGAIVDDVLSWTSGQPFLTIALCDQVVSTGNTDVASFVRDEVGNPTTFKVHFGRIEDIVKERIAGSSQARSKYLAMLAGKRVHGVPARDEESLLLAGLVQRERDGSLRLRNRIYGMAFGKAWVNAILPAPPVPRWVAPLLGGLVAAGAATGLALWKREQYRQEAEVVERAQRADKGAVEIRTGKDDEQVGALWQTLRRDGLTRDGSRVHQAARAYFDRRTNEVRSLAVDLAAAGCAEEAAILDAFVKARNGDAAGPPPSAAIAGTLWLPVPTGKGNEVDRCKERRAEVCDRLTLSGGELAASCSGKLVVFRPEGAPALLSGTGRYRVPLRSEGGWSIGGSADTLIVNHGESAVTIPACPGAARGDTAIRADARAVGSGVRIAWVCPDGTYRRLAARDLEAFFDEIAKGKQLDGAPAGYDVGNAAWLGETLITVTVRPKGGLQVDRGRFLAFPYLTAVRELAAGRHLALGTEDAAHDGIASSPLLAVLGLTGDHLVMERQWKVTDCQSPACLVRAVAGVDLDHVAAIVAGIAGGSSLDRVWLVLTRGDRTEGVLLSGESPIDLAVGEWQSQRVAAVPLSGRIRLHAWDAAKDASWAATERRFGLTVRFGETPRIERIEEAGPQKVRRFEDVFAP